MQRKAPSGHMRVSCALQLGNPVGIRDHLRSVPEINCAKPCFQEASHATLGAQIDQ